MKSVIYLLALIVAGAELCSGQNVLNGSFETGTAPPFGGAYVPAPNSTTISGWTIQSGSVDYIGNDTWQAADGNRSLDLSGHNAGTIRQNVSGFTPGHQYRLSFYMAGNNDGVPRTFHLQAGIGSVTQTFTFDATGYTYSNMGWSLRTMVFTATNTTLALTFTSLDAGNAGPALDNVSISAAPASGCVSPPSGLVSWWRAENNASDQVGRNNGMLIGNVSFVAGKVGLGFGLNGSNSFVQIPHHASLHLTNQFTLEFWYLEQGKTWWYSMMTKRDGGYAPANFGIHVGPLGFSQGLQLFFTDPTVGGDSTSDYLPVPSSGVFHHLAATFRQADSGHVELKTFVDGQLVKTTMALGNLANTLNTAPILIGADYAAQDFFKGIIDEVSIFNRALSLAEIQAIHNAGGAGKCVSPPQPCAPAPLGLVSWWRAEGNAMDQVGGNTGTLVGNVTYRPGRVGQGFVLDGVGDAVNVGNPANLQLQNFTIEAWIKRAHPSRATQGPQASGGIFDGSAGGYALVLNDDGRVVLSKVGVGGVFSTNTITDTNLFHHVAVTKSGSSVMFYVDGVAESAGPYDPGFVFNGPMAIGARGGDYGTSFFGSIDEVSVYNRALTTGEIQSLYNADGAGKCTASDPPPATVACWNVNSHCYEIVRTNLAWPDALTAAAGRTYQGLPGHLATITSAAENQFITANFSTGVASEFTWIAGREPADDGVWRWAAGPESGTQFSFWASPTPPANFANWGGVEPNDNKPGEDYAMFNLGLAFNGIANGQWADAIATPNFSDPVVGYLVEYEPVAPASNCVAPPSGLVSWWRGENSTVDAAGSNNGTNVGNVTYSSGKVGQAFGFDGVSSGVRLGNPASLQLQTFTIELWTKRASTTRASVPLIYVNGAFLHYGDQGYGFGPHNDGRLVLTKVGVGGVYSSALQITDTNFHHVAVTKTGSSVTFYVDGVAEVAAPYDPGFVFNTPVAIGARGTDMAASFLGAIDELAVYNRALSQAEIQNIYNTGSAGKCVVTTPPTITTQPANQTVTVGATASFSVTADGTPPLSYQWRRGGAKINGATASSLVLASAQFVNAGTYSVVVSNSTGTAISSNAMLTVNPTVCVPQLSGLVSWWRGENSTVDAADGNNGTIAGTGTVAYGPGVVGQAFVFDGTHRDRVNVGNPTNLRLENFTLEAWVKRSNATVTSFDVLGADGSVAGDGAVIFGYGRGGYVFALANNGRMIAGRTDIDGIISAPLVTDTNWHHLAVTKSGTNAVFYLDGLPQATPAYAHPAPYTFDDATCTCSAAASIGSRGDGRGGTFFGMIDEPAVFNRALTAVEIQGIYNAGGLGRCQEPPVILTQPASQRVTVGSRATLGVVASGTPQLWYQWRRNGDNLAGATDSVLNFTASNDSGGLYSVRVTNAFGSVISSNALLRVNHAPVADANATRSLFIVPSGCDPTVVLDGSRSSDPDADPLQYFWFKTGETDAFATGVVAMVTLPLGAHTLTLVVNDGLATSAQTFVVELITPAQAVERLIALVNSQAGKPQPLVATLSAALASIERDNATAAINQLEAFQNKVRAQVVPDDPALARQFIQAAQDIIDAGSRDCASAKPHGKIGKVHRKGNGRMTLEFSASPGQVYLIEVSTNLVDWEKIGVAIERGSGEFEFEDPNAARAPTRFYRIVLP